MRPFDSNSKVFQILLEKPIKYFKENWLLFKFLIAFLCALLALFSALSL